MPYTRWHFELGLCGLAMLRTGSTTTDERLDEYTAALARPRPPDPAAARVAGGGVEHDVVSGYARWAPVYDAPGQSADRARTTGGPGDRRRMAGPVDGSSTPPAARAATP